ncbi:hypothetical protein PFICI_02723 [Pestalotiopsis fici W106-1]|uniref:NACHT domain-containing protein n=1 Tax=Pestalotiopsis fici (strain W106-1 / CGMCC3.15140) TaxID=1229662 RepID=W3XF23_PESFW|nr:uncharacterized protein PFICI_02723 [Pestalotiopsis fici W106-1]ETS84698.1 hypothetical protein PFICI_02723 [Pestalotiopsis fici W106-1]
MGSPSKHAPHEESDESEEEVLQEISPDDINVAIFCALVEESTAVRYTLDREFACKAYGKQSYVYTVGSIGAHNVVIAEPAEMGPVNAAHCAAHVSQQFPNVRLALMVGIGAGIPSNNLDIRLGDIAISVPRDDHPGVVQYDLGKYEAGAFKRKGALNKPPRILTSAIRALEGDELRNKFPIRRILKRIVRQNDKFRRPDSEDILFHNTFPHVQKGSDCSACWASDDKRVVSRIPRQLPNEPVTHRGLILSGGGVIKNPADREQFRRGYESAICFEMEAAGIMDELPCLVIRGISDYADTHKHDDWHYYAAAAAAAYCKAILSKVPVEEVTETPRMREVVKKVDEIQRTVQETRVTAKEIHAIAHFDKIRKWLSPPDPSTNFNKAREQHYEKTGQWFLDSEVYIKWKTERNSFLWLQGIPGCGKTILSSSVVADLQDGPSRSLVYFYFDFSDVAKQTLEQAVRSLIYQLYHKQADLRQEVDDFYSSCDNGDRQPLRSALLELFKSMIRRAGEVWIVLDALDECHTRNERAVSGLMSYIKGLRDSTTNLHLLVTSRPEHDIQSAIRNWARDSEILPLESIRVKDDINLYIEVRVGQLSRWRERPRIQKEIKTVLSNKANGMFRWVSCQFDVLSGCLDPESVQRELASLPRTLDETYERILKTIEPNRLNSAIRLLQFLAYSNRPLRLEEAVDAVAVNISKEPMFDPEYRMPCPEEIVGYCSSLTVLVKRKDQRYRTDIVEIQLAHFSVQEYLTSERLEKSVAPRLSHSSASIALTTVCLSYLLSLDYSYRPEEAEKNYPLAEYSAQYWPTHAAITEQSTNSTLPIIRNLKELADTNK